MQFFSFDLKNILKTSKVSDWDMWHHAIFFAHSALLVNRFLPLYDINPDPCLGQTLTPTWKSPLFDSGSRTQSLFNLLTSERFETWMKISQNFMRIKLWEVKNFIRLKNPHPREREYNFLLRNWSLSNMNFILNIYAPKTIIKFIFDQVCDHVSKYGKLFCIFH